MIENNQCSSPGCGCNLSSYSTSKKCPSCGNRLRLLGRLERAEFRLSCQNCGYQSSLLTKEELQEVL